MRFKPVSGGQDQIIVINWRQAAVCACRLTVLGIMNNETIQYCFWERPIYAVSSTIDQVGYLISLSK